MLMTIMDPDKLIVETELNRDDVCAFYQCINGGW